MSQKILNYYKLIDEFLLTQFDYAMGELPIEDITIHYEGLLNYLETIKFESTEFESAKNHHLNQLKSATTHLVGFPQFKYDSHLKVSKEELLNKRSQISSIDFLYQLKEFNQLELSSLGLNLEEQPACWINKNDRPISFQSSPDSLRRTLFEIDHFENKSEYFFKISPKNSGFFTDSGLGASRLIRVDMSARYECHRYEDRYECHVPFVSHIHYKKSMAPKRLILM